MSAAVPSNTAKWAAAYIEKYGFSVVPLPVRSKKPVKKDWGNDVISTVDDAIEFFKHNKGANIGVALGPSRVCSWDIDDEPATRLICEEFGFDLDAMLAATPTIQGQAPGYRMMFRIPDGVDIPYHSLTWPKQDGSGGRFTVFELRAACDGQQRQDVLPPSIHPDTGKPYTWITLPNGSLPNPPDWLMTIWKQWDKFKPQLLDVCPWAEKKNIELPSPKQSQPAQGASVIDAFAAANDIHSTLKQYGYKPAGKRWLSPHSQTKLPGVNVFPDGRAWIHHASDPLCSDESGKPVNSFDLFCYYEHNGDVSKAVKAAAKSLGMDSVPRERKPKQVEKIDHETGEITIEGEFSVTEKSATAVMSPADWKAILEGNNSGPYNNLDNAVRVIERDPELYGKIWYDEFLDRIVTTWQGDQRDWKDSDDVLLQLYMQRYVGLSKIGVNTCHDAALVAAFRNIKNECRDYLLYPVWDGVPRLNAMMHEAFGAEDNAYSEAVGRCWFISMVARVMQPGCKVDTVPVFEGAQGRGKSTAMSIIGGKWFVECHENVMSKDLYDVLDGHMLVEIAEMHSFSKAEVERVKGIISCQVDRYRKAYGRNAQDHPRKTVLACTTNRDDWQRDDTGARRFWPIFCHDINHEWLRVHRDQLFAEAVFLYKEGTPWWDVPDDHQKIEVEKRRDVDAWEPHIVDWIGSRSVVLSQSVLADCLNIEIQYHDQKAKNRVSKVMKAIGWVQRYEKINGKSVRAWTKP